MATSSTVNTVTISTPGYISAEQSQGKPRLNSDIYALGLSGILQLFQKFKSYRSPEVLIAQFMLTAVCFYSIAEFIYLRVENKARS
ncbi:MAG: hypothetical protein KI793_10660 [Rivularia sp. (in: Bacteria)]|nr:hypothetical protein [Rivularia sp. MS3]